MKDSPQQRGGNERAKKLSPEERKAIASKAAIARWGEKSSENKEDLPRASHMGEREIGGISIPVFNLQDGRRLISERGFLSIIGAKGRGKSGGHRIAQILADNLIKSFFSNKILVAIANPIQFLTPTGNLAFGYEAEILAAFCLSFVKAKNAGILKTVVQKRYGKYCEDIVHAYAVLGIVGWIDEATGYQNERTRDALHKILEKYLLPHWATWASTFPDEYYEQIFRLRGWTYDPSSLARPGVLGHITNDIVYSRLAPGVLGSLRKKNPVLVNGRRARKHHQWLTQDYGHPKLKSHIDNLIFLAKGFDSWRSFHIHLKKAAPRLNDQAEFDFDDY
jgi:hypothetical protein